MTCHPTLHLSIEPEMCFPFAVDVTPGSHDTGAALPGSASVVGVALWEWRGGSGVVGVGGGVVGVAVDLAATSAAHIVVVSGCRHCEALQPPSFKNYRAQSLAATTNNYKHNVSREPSRFSP